MNASLPTQTKTAKPGFDAKVLRKTVLDMAYAGATVHIGCAFSIIELLAVLYRSHLRYPGNDPMAAERDYLVLSKGHGVMAQYACMRELGWLKDEAFTGYFADGSDLKGLSDSRIPGLEVTSGSLGHGFSVGVGMAMGPSCVAPIKRPMPWWVMAKSTRVRSGKAPCLPRTMR